MLFIITFAKTLLVMKKLLLLLAFLVTTATIRAQIQNPETPTVKITENTQEELFGMLALLGAEAWRFDLSAFSDAEYRFNPFFDEYVAGEKMEKDNDNGFMYRLPSNWQPKFPDPDSWNKLLSDKNPRLSADGEKWLSFENMGLYVVPKNDSTIVVRVNLYGNAALSRELKLRPLQNTEDNPQYTYDYRPFKIEPFESGKQRVPLLLIGSFWWDEKFKIHRFCGVNEFAPDMSDDELNDIPHYYVIGVEVERIE